MYALYIFQTSVASICAPDRCSVVCNRSSKCFICQHTRVLLLSSFGAYQFLHDIVSFTNSVDHLYAMSHIPYFLFSSKLLSSTSFLLLLLFTIIPDSTRSNFSIVFSSVIGEHKESVQGNTKRAFRGTQRERSGEHKESVQGNTKRAFKGNTKRAFRGTQRERSGEHKESIQGNTKRAFRGTQRERSRSGLNSHARSLLRQ